VDYWQHCLRRLESELPPQQFNTWIRPLQCKDGENAVALQLYAPNANQAVDNFGSAE